MTPACPLDDRWVGLLEREIPAEDAGTLTGHAAVCPACSARRDRIARGLSRARTLAPRAAPPPPLPPLPARRWSLRFLFSNAVTAGPESPVPRLLPAASPAMLSSGRVAAPNADRVLDAREGRGRQDPTPIRGSISRHRVRRLVLPAAAAVGLALGGAWLLRPFPPVATVAWIQGTQGSGRATGTALRPGLEIGTDAGGRIGIRFAGGAEVSWNRDTRARIQSGMEVALSAGEIHVRAPKGARGFAVSTPHGRFVDLGTAFIVRTGPARSTATVLRGRIRADGGGAPREAGEGERVALGAEVSVDRPSPAEGDASLAWMREALLSRRFESVPLPELLDVIESVTPFRFEVPREEATAVTLTASLGGASSEGILEGLVEALGWTAVRNGNQVRLAPPASRPR